MRSHYIGCIDIWKEMEERCRRIKSIWKCCDGSDVSIQKLNANEGRGRGANAHTKPRPWGVVTLQPIQTSLILHPHVISLTLPHLPLLFSLTIPTLLPLFWCFIPYSSHVPFVSIPLPLFLFKTSLLSKIYSLYNFFH